MYDTHRKEYLIKRRVCFAQLLLCSKICSNSTGTQVIVDYPLLISCDKSASCSIPMEALYEQKFVLVKFSRLRHVTDAKTCLGHHESRRFGEPSTYLAFDYTTTTHCHNFEHTIARSRRLSRDSTCYKSSNRGGHRIRTRRLASSPCLPPSWCRRASELMRRSTPPKTLSRSPRRNCRLCREYVACGSSLP